MSSEARAMVYGLAHEAVTTRFDQELGGAQAHLAARQAHFQEIQAAPRLSSELEAPITEFIAARTLVDLATTAVLLTHARRRNKGLRIDVQHISERVNDLDIRIRTRQPRTGLRRWLPRL